MITVRNQSVALSVSARTGAATTLKAGMVVKFAQGAASGDQPTVVPVVAADLSDPKVVKGIVDYITPDSQDVDFDVTTATLALSPIAVVIPAGAQVNVWLGKLVIAYHESLLPAGFKAANARESDKVSFDADTGLPAAYNAAGADGTQTPVGMVYRVDGPEVTFIITL